MARLFGFVGNRADLGARVLELESKPLKVVAKGSTLGWGIGFYQSGEVLLRRRPIDERPEIDVAALAKDLRADVLIGHVRAAVLKARLDVSNQALALTPDKAMAYGDAFNADVRAFNAALATYRKSRSAGDTEAGRCGCSRHGFHRSRHAWRQ